MAEPQEGKKKTKDWRTRCTKGDRRTRENALSGVHKQMEDLGLAALHTATTKRSYVRLYSFSPRNREQMEYMGGVGSARELAKLEKAAVVTARETDLAKKKNGGGCVT